MKLRLPAWPCRWRWYLHWKWRVEGRCPKCGSWFWQRFGVNLALRGCLSCGHCENVR